MKDEREGLDGTCVHDKKGAQSVVVWGSFEPKSGSPKKYVHTVYS